MNKVAVIAVIFCAVTVVSCSVLSARTKRVTVMLGQEAFTLEVARTDTERQTGLSNRDVLPAHHGMLFVFEKPGRYAFWMKDTRIPLDIIWLNHGTVVDIATLPAQEAGKAPARHDPVSDADRVIEINAGEAARLGLDIGMRVEGI